MTTRHREAEIALGARSRHKAEAELQLVDSARFAAAMTEFIEWLTFAYWVRLVVELEGGVSSKMRPILNERCPGFIAALTAYRESRPDERESFCGSVSSSGSITISSRPQTRRDGDMLSAFMPPGIPGLTPCGSIGFSVTMPGNGCPRQSFRLSMSGGRPLRYVSRPDRRRAPRRRGPPRRIPAAIPLSRNRTDPTSALQGAL
jgi:hypothetical protein